MSFLFFGVEPRDVRFVFWNCFLRIECPCARCECLSRANSAMGVHLALDAAEHTCARCNFLPRRGVRTALSAPHHTLSSSHIFPYGSSESPATASAKGASYNDLFSLVKIFVLRQVNLCLMPNGFSKKYKLTFR